MSDAVITPTSANFQLADTLEAFFGPPVAEVLSASSPDLEPDFSMWHAGATSYVRELTKQVGSKPGTAIIVIPQTPGVRFEAGNSIAFRADAITYKIKSGWDVVIKRKTRTGLHVIEFMGEVVNISNERDRGTEGIVVRAVDARRQMEDIKIVGRFQINPNPSLPAGAEWNQAEHAIFNPGGRPNCIFTSGGIPVFCPPDYGLSENENPPTPDTASQTKATYWTLGNILKYLNYWYTPGVYTPTQWKWFYKTPATLNWPYSFGSEIDTERVADFDEAVGLNPSARGSARKGREMVLEGMYLLEALEYLLYTAGGYTLAYEPNWQELES